MKITSPRIWRLGCVVAFAILGSIATAADLAVKRGQQTVKRSVLPVVCIAFGTNGIGMPIHSISLRNAATGRSKKFLVSKSFGNSRPDYLTAVAGETVLSLLTLHLVPGDYVLERVEYAPGKNDSFEYSFDFTQRNGCEYKFHVAPEAVNYVGSIEFSAAWSPVVFRPSPNVLHDSMIERSLPTLVRVKRTAERDKKWVSDQIPGLRDFPSIISVITETTRQGQ